MADSYNCWKCGADLSDLAFPLGRMSKCKKCRADLHVCKQCKFFDKSRANQCQEPVADAVTDKQRANFCGYFEINENAFQQHENSVDSAAQQELSALFGEPVDVPSGDSSSNSQAELEKLFGISEPNKDEKP